MIAKVTQLITLTLVTILIISGCGGGSSDSGMLIEGTLTQGTGGAHAEALNFKHDDGERIDGVEVCALGECSPTDDAGQWGFVAGSDFSGGDVLFSFNGHGIDTGTVLHIPEGATDVVIDFRHTADGTVVAEHVTVDGEEHHMEESDPEDDHQDEDDHHDDEGDHHH